MGEQPVPVEDEVERALATMRAGFLSGSDQISASVASLEEHMDEAPLDEREAVRTAVGQIVTAHERLKLKMEHLPARSWDQFKVVVSVVKAQQALLDELGLLVKEHVLPRQVQNLAVMPFPAGLAPEPAPAPPPPRAPASDPLPRLRRRDIAPRADDSDPERRPMLPLARERVAAAFSGLAAMVVAGVVLSLIPRDVQLQEVAARFVEMVGTGGENAPSRGPDATAEAEPPPAAVKLPRAEPAPAAKVAVAAPSDRKRAPAPPPDVAARPDPPAPAEPENKRAVAHKVAAKPAAPPAKAPDKQFVPVVFTHKDRATVMQALTDLKQQYPNLLIGRKGEVLPVNLGEKGVWHRLVLLPAASRPQATKLCGQLRAKGYDRCWVKAY